jgi:hypothetical protein
MKWKMISMCKDGHIVPVERNDDVQFLEESICTQHCIQVGMEQDGKETTQAAVHK